MCVEENVRPREALSACVNENGIHISHKHETESKAGRKGGMEGGKRHRVHGTQYYNGGCQSALVSTEAVWLGRKV